MELDEFIKDVVVKIEKGLADANTELSDKKAALYSRRGENDIEFDIAVTSRVSTEAGGKAGVKIVSVVDIGGKMGSSASHENASRIKFGLSLNPAVATIGNALRTI